MDVPKMKTPSRLNSFLSSMRYEHLVAGVCGGVTSTLILHPLDLIKIRFAGTKLYLAVVEGFSLSFAFVLTQ